MDYAKLRQSKSGELRLAATGSRPDTCARFARIASRTNALRGSYVCRTNVLGWVADEWQPATALKYASSSHPWEPLGWGDKVQGALRKRGERFHGDSMTLAGWPDAAYGDQSAEGKCRLGYVIGWMSSTLKGPCRIC